MPWPANYSRRENCAYVMCEADGHSTCWHFGTYYDALCAAIQAYLDAPTEENLAALKAIYEDNQGAVNE